MDMYAEISALYERMSEFELNQSDIALWYALLHKANKCGWQREFSVALKELECLACMSKKTVQRSRDNLAEKGLIVWISREGNQSAIYSMVSLVRHFAGQNAPQSDHQCDHQSDQQEQKIPFAGQFAGHIAGQNCPQSDHITIQDKYKDNGVVARDVADDLTEDDIEMGEVQRVYAECSLGAISAHIDRQLAEMATEYTADWLIRAMRVTGDKPDKQRHLGLVKGILRRWKDAGHPDDNAPCTLLPFRAREPCIVEDSRGNRYTMSKDEFDAEIAHYETRIDMHFDYISPTHIKCYSGARS